MRRIPTIACLAALCAFGSTLRADEVNTQQSTRAVSRRQWIGIAIGAGAGFGAGWLSLFGRVDEGKGAEDEVYASLAVGTVVGAVCGYFIGRTAAWNETTISRIDPPPVPAYAGRSAERETTRIEIELASMIRHSATQIPRLSYEPLVESAEFAGTLSLP